MAKNALHKKQVQLWWVALGVVGAGCLDGLIEDPGIEPSDDVANMPIPVGPNDAEGGLGASSAPAQSTAGGPMVEVAPTAGTSAAATTTAATTTLSPVGSANGGSAGSGSTGSTETRDDGASGAAPSDLDAGAFEEADCGDAGPDAMPSSDPVTTGASAQTVTEGPQGSSSAI